MGYDMSIQEPELSVVEECTQRRNALSAIYAQRNPIEPKPDMTKASGWEPIPGTGNPAWWELEAKATAARAALDDVEINVYFHLNIWGMGRCREAMCAFDMAFEANHPPFPKIEEYGLTYWPEAEDNHPVDSPEGRYLAAVADVTDGMHFEVPGIPLYKVGSNDGWLVTPLECQGALAKFEANKNTEAETPPWWEQWIRFLLIAQARGGFRVW